MNTQVSYKHLYNSPKRAQWFVFVFVFVICVISALFNDLGRELLRYEFSLLSQHEYWRLISGHFVHLGWSHFALNMTGLFALWLIYGGVYPTRTWLLILTVAALGISICFIFFEKNLDWYVGLSGILHTILSVVLTYLLLHSLFKNKKCFHFEDGILLVFLLIKLTYEQLFGAVPLTESGSGGPIVVNAHFYGAIIGCICAIFLFKFTYRESTI